MQLLEVFKDKDGKIISYKPIGGSCITDNNEPIIFDKVSDLRKAMKEHPDIFQDAVGGQRYFTLHEEKPILSVSEVKHIQIVEE